MLKKAIEDRKAITDKINALDKLLVDEKRDAFTDDEQTDYAKWSKDEKAFDIKITDLEAREERLKGIATLADAAKLAGGKVVTINSEDKRVAKDFDFMKAVGEATKAGKFEGLEKEVIQEGSEEARAFGGATGNMNIVVPSKWMDLTDSNTQHEKRTDIDQATSALAPVFLGPYQDALREFAIYLQIEAINRLQLTADFKIPKTVAQTLAWATAENSAAADGGANFGSDTLTPFRLTGFVDISNELIHQNGPAVTNAVMRDLGRSEAALINTAMMATASVTNSPGSLAATSGVLTFTEATPFSAGVSALSDIIEAEQTVANDHGLDGALAYVLSTKLLTDLKKSAVVSSIIPGMTLRSYNDYQINGYLAKFSTGATSNGTTSADFIYGDWSKVFFGRFGGLNILVDPFTVAGNNQIRLVVNSMVDWSLIQGAAFVKATTLLS